MNLRKLKSLMLVAACVLAAVSCKDDDDDANVAYVDGSLSFSLPEFVLPGQTVTMTPKGLSHPDGGEIGYCWKVTPTMTQYDTTRFENGLDKNGRESDGSFTHKFSDTLQTYTVYCYGFATDYTSSSAGIKTTVVSPGPEQSITGTGISEKEDKYVTVEGNRFYYTRIGDLDWFMQNLAYTGKGIPFRKGEAMDGVFGRYYSYNEAIKACPEGWRLPTDAEWSSMANTVLETTESYTGKIIPGIAGKLITDAYFNNVKMWEYWPSVGKPTNDSRLSMIPVGYANLGAAAEDGSYPSVTFKGIYEYATFWTADKTAGNDSMAYYRYIFYDQPDMMIGTGDVETFGASVRCVRKAE